MDRAWRYRAWFELSPPLSGFPSDPPLDVPGAVWEPAEVAGAGGCWSGMVTAETYDEAEQTVHAAALAAQATILTAGQADRHDEASGGAAELATAQQAEARAAQVFLAARDLLAAADTDELRGAMQAAVDHAATDLNSKRSRAQELSPAAVTAGEGVQASVVIAIYHPPLQDQVPDRLGAEVRYTDDDGIPRLAYVTELGTGGALGLEIRGPADTRYRPLAAGGVAHDENQATGTWHWPPQ